MLRKAVGEFDGATLGTGGRLGTAITSDNVQSSAFLQIAITPIQSLVIVVLRETHP